MPSGSDVVVITVGNTISIENCFVSFPALLEALTVNVKFPPAVGVPVIAPFEARVKPVGRLPLIVVQVIGCIPAAARAWLYATPTMLYGSGDVVVIDGVVPHAVYVPSINSAPVLPGSK
jgi:hypothetical protein